MQFTDAVFSVAQEITLYFPVTYVALLKTAVFNETSFTSPTGDSCRLGLA